MILVDTSVLIDLFKGNNNQPVADLRQIIKQQMPFGISSVIYQEILQGVKTEKEYVSLKQYLSTQRFFHPKDPLDSYAAAAEIFYTCRRSGVTIRSTIDCLIAQIAIEHNLLLLHNDKDFTAMGTVVDLQFYRDLS